MNQSAVWVINNNWIFWVYDPIKYTNEEKRWVMDIDLVNGCFVLGLW